MAERINGFKKIYSLNGYKINEDTVLNKYIPFNYLEKNIKDKEIVFVSPKTWQDPFEKIYYTAENFEEYGYKKPNIFCMCLSESSWENEAAACKMYQNSTEKMIQVRFHAKKMLEQLDKFCKTQNFSIYIGKIDYSFFQAEIKNLYKESDQHHASYFPKKNFYDEHYCNLLLLKRKAFEFEHEIRMFLIPDDKNAKYSDDIFRIPQFYYNNDTIYQLKIAPLQPFSFEDPRQKEYDKLQEEENLHYKNVLTDLLSELDPDKIKQSDLYKTADIIDLSKKEYIFPEYIF